MNKRLLILTTAFLITSTITGCNVKTSNKDIQKLLESDNDYTQLESASAKFIAEADISNDIKAVLFSAKPADSGKTEHFIATIDRAANDITPIETSYFPLNALQKEIQTKRTQSTNISYFEQMTEYLKENGEYCLEDPDYAEKYLQLITADNNIISTSKVQEIISDAVSEEFGFEPEDDFFIIFEENNANPLCYGARDENPAYVGNKAWAAYDTNGKLEGVYKTKSELYFKYTGQDMEFTEDQSDKPKELLRFATVNDNAPYSYMSDGMLLGTDVDIARAIAETLEMELEISIMSESAAISGISDGTYHMAMGSFTNSTKGKNISFTDDYHNDFVIMLSNFHPQISDSVCVALDTLKSDGTIDSIIDKYSNIASRPISNKSVNTETEQTETPVSEVSDISYRVRKSTEDADTQLGAFSSLENAKRAADENKNLGYKVYDINGNLIYTP